MISKNQKSLRREVERVRTEYDRLGRFSEYKSLKIESKAFLALCEKANSPFSLKCWLLYKYKQFDQVVKTSVDPFMYDDLKLFEDDYQCASFFSKYVDFKLDIDREKVAFDKWLAAEERCRSTNTIFRSRWYEGFLFPQPVEQILFIAQQKIASILGEVPNDILARGRFGPGADLSTDRSKIDSYYKYSAPGSCTPGILTLFSNLGCEIDDRRVDVLEDCILTNSSRLTFVPKNAKTDRAICIEPRWNIFFQLSVAEHIADRLKRFGVDITNQTQNQELARNAHIASLSTIDLSSASDMVSKNLVLDLLPDAWSDLLFRLRCPETVYRERTFKLEKISSMGNGYTFPLETLLFYALSWATAEFYGSRTEFVTAYGDDIICPRECARQLIDVLGYCGFSVNTEKTYIDGNFFESCGADFFQGKNVRPIYLKRKVRHAEEAFRLCNQIFALARRRTKMRGLCRRTMVAYNYVIDEIPNSLRLFGPVGYGDAFVHATFDRAAASLFPLQGGWEGYALVGLLPVQKRFSAFGDGLLFSKLSGGSFTGNYVSRRGAVTVMAKALVVHEYIDFALI